MSARVVLPALEAIGAGATLRRSCGDLHALLGALDEGLAPARILIVGSGTDEAVAHVVETSARLATLVAIDPDAASAARVAARAEEAARRAGRQPAIAVHHARLLGTPRGAPHFTRLPALVAALCGPPFDLVLVVLRAAPGDLAATLGQVLPMAGPDGVVCVTPLDRDAGDLEVVRRVVAETSGPAVLWQPDGGDPIAALIGVRRAIHTHEESRTWTTTALAADGVTAARARDHVAACAALRHWLASRLVWSTADLLLPLAELPPALSVRDVVDRCARSEGGVSGFGAAVTLAMLYRACGYPATVYQYGVRDLFWHMSTLVRLPDGRILVEDALFDAEVRLGDEPADWREVLAVVHAGRAGLLRVESTLGGQRPHVYSRASLPAAEADGYLTAAERRLLEAAMAGCRRVTAEPRGMLVQPITASFEAYTCIPVHARALAAIRARTGIDHPRALLGLPCGALPLSGDAALDRDIVQALDDWDQLARALAVGA